MSAFTRANGATSAWKIDPVPRFTGRNSAETVFFFTASKCTAMRTAQQSSQIDPNRGGEGLLRKYLKQSSPFRRHLLIAMVHTVFVQPSTLNVEASKWRSWWKGTKEDTVWQSDSHLNFQIHALWLKQLIITILAAAMSLSHKRLEGQHLASAIARVEQKNSSRMIAAARAHCRTNSMRFHEANLETWRASWLQWASW